MLRFKFLPRYLYLPCSMRTSISLSFTDLPFNFRSPHHIFHSYSPVDYYLYRLHIVSLLNPELQYEKKKKPTNNGADWNVMISSTYYPIHNCWNLDFGYSNTD